MLKVHCCFVVSHTRSDINPFKIWRHNLWTGGQDKKIVMLQWSLLSCKEQPHCSALQFKYIPTNWKGSITLWCLGYIIQIPNNSGAYEYRQRKHILMVHQPISPFVLKMDDKSSRPLNSTNRLPAWPKYSRAITVCITILMRWWTFACSQTWPFITLNRSDSFLAWDRTERPLVIISDTGHQNCRETLRIWHQWQRLKNTSSSSVNHECLWVGNIWKESCAHS